MNAGTAPISQRPAPEGHAGGGGGGGQPPVDRMGDPRLDVLKEKLRQYGPWVGYSLFFFVALLYFAYLTFPYDRLRDRIVADFEKSQKVVPGGSRQVLSIGKLRPSWFTGVILEDVDLTSIPADPTKPSSTLHADEIKLRVGFGSLFSKNKDVTLSAKALGGTIEGSVTHTKTANPTPTKSNDKDKGDKYDRVIHFELDGISLNDVAPMRDAIGASISGTMKGTIDLTLGESRLDKANGTIALDIDNFGLPGEIDKEAQEACKNPPPPPPPPPPGAPPQPPPGPCDPKRVHFKVPALKTFFGKDEVALPVIAIGPMPIQISVKNGVARIDKFAASGKDVDVALDGQVTLREQIGESDVNIGVRFKFNDSYRKKNPAAEGVLLLLDNEPKLKAGKRPDGFYGLKLVGLLGAQLQVLPNPTGTMGAPGMPPRPLVPPGMPGALGAPPNGP
jgi:type II secretion system protein N